MNVTLQAVGTVVQVAGVALLYLHWRRRRGLGGGVLATGWALILIGIVPWMLGVSVERGLALASLPPMVVGLFLSAPHGLADLRSAARERPVRRRTAAGDVPAPAAEPPSPGRLARNAARWVGSVIIVPAVAIASMAAWQGFAPGSDVNRASFSIFVLMIAWVATLLWLLASAKPWRVTLITALVAAAIGGGIFIMRSGGTI